MVQRVALPVLALLIAASVSACSHDEAKALRSYDMELDLVRGEIQQLRRYQPRVAERRSADRLKQFVTVEILTRASRVSELLRDIDAPNAHLKSMHRELLAIWRDYHDMFADLALDLNDANLTERKRDVYEELEALMERFRTWNAHLIAYRDRVDGWG